MVRPANVTASVGDKVWIHCKGSGIPSPDVNYLRNKGGKKVLNETHFVRFPNGSMMIKSMRLEDAGIYMCWLKNNYSSIYSTFSISVAGTFAVLVTSFYILFTFSQDFMMLMLFANIIYFCSTNVLTKRFFLVSKDFLSFYVLTFFLYLVAEEEIEKNSSSSMDRTIGIAVGCAGLYIILVIGLMIYCRARRARLLKGNKIIFHPFHNV